MDERWQEIERIYHVARGLNPSTRILSYEDLGQVCSGRRDWGGCEARPSASFWSDG